MEAGRYNLRSNRRECSIPVQLQLPIDEDFVMASKSHMESDQAGQVFYELSDIDLADLIWHLNQNLCPIIANRQNAFAACGKASVPSTPGLSPSTSEQAAINQKNLEQLNALGQQCLREGEHQLD